MLAFELANRAWFAQWITDRGDAFFAEYAERFASLLAEQAAGVSAFHVLVLDREVVGRFNLVDVADGAAELGYRVAERVAGRGVATAAVAEICEVAPGLGVRTIRAATSTANVASQKVLSHNGFREVGPADPAAIGGKTGSWWERSI